MFLSFKLKRSFIIVILSLAILLGTTITIIRNFPISTFVDYHGFLAAENAPNSKNSEKSFIKWVDFKPTSSIMEKTMKLDIESIDKPVHLDWIELLSVLAARYGGDFSRFKEKDLTELVKRLENGEKIEDITADMKYYTYYHEAYTAVLGEFLGHFSIQQTDEKDKNNIVWTEKYGLKVFSPIARGYGYSHYDDFGASRSYGYKRRHLGHDMMGSIGTPIIAIESGIVEAIGWNMYGGWRIGIRSFDGKRYYYYAHLRKDHPYPADLAQGQIVKAGDVIGYLGMTGYSSKENVNNIDTPHLHMGIQLIFDDSQKDGNGEIWIDCYEIAKLLSKNTSSVVKDEQSGEYRRKFDFFEKSVENTE